MHRNPIHHRMFRIRASVMGLCLAIGAVISQVHAAPGPQGAPAGNAAQAWRDVAPLLKPRSETNPGGLLSVDEWNTLWLIQDRDHRSDAEIEQAKVFVSRLQPAMRLLDEAAAQDRCDFELDRAQGFSLKLPHLTTMRAGTRMLLLRGEVLAHDGDMQGFIDAQAAVARVALQPVQDKTTIGGMVGQAIATTGMISMRRAIDDGAIPQPLAKDALEALAPLRGDDPMRTADAPAREFEMLQEELTRAASRNQDGREFRRDFRNRFGIDMQREVGDAREGGEDDRTSPQEMLAALPAIKPVYNLYGEALRERDPAKARALIRKADAMAEALQPPASLLRALLPACESLLDRRERLIADRDALMRTLQAIAEDPQGANRHSAPAVLWARVAARVGALPDDTQAAVETLRNRPATLTNDDRAKASACLEGCEATIFEAMRVAAACERKDLDFSKVPQLKAWPPLPTLGGLRGAARLAALRAASLDTDAAIERLDLAFAAVAALSSDPSQACNSTAAQIARELVPAVAAIAGRHDLNDERRAKLQAAVHRIDRADAFGFRASLAAERALLVERFRNMNLSADLELLQRELRRRTPEWVLAARIETGAMHDPVTNPGALEDIADLFPSDRLRKARESEKALDEAIDRAREKAGARDQGAQARPPALGSLPIEPIRDPGTDAQEAQATLSALDAALRSNR